MLTKPGWRIATLPLPPTTNQMYVATGGKKRLTETARIWKRKTKQEVWAQTNMQPMMEGKIQVKIEFHLMHDRDIDNFKALFDAMSGVAWMDDRQVVMTQCRKKMDKSAYLVIAWGPDEGEEITF